MAKYLTAWDFFRLMVYKTCPRQAKLKYLDKIPELPRPLPPGQREHANDRGSRIHEAAEHYINGTRDDMIHELKHFEKELQKARTLYMQKQAFTEETWLFGEDWSILDADAPYSEIWLRVIADIHIFLTPEKLLIVDLKTGRKDGNEVKHGRQLQLYTVSALLRFPDVKEVVAEAWYLDKNELMQHHYTADRGLKYFETFNQQALHMLSDESFLPTPSMWNCRFCPYGPEEHSNKWVTKCGACDVGVG